MLGSGGAGFLRRVTKGKNKVLKKTIFLLIGNSGAIGIIGVIGDCIP